MSVRKRTQAVKPIAVGYVKVTDQPRRIICSLYKTLMSKTFPQESSEAILNLRKSALPRTKKLHQRVLTECIEKHFEEKHGLIWLLKKEAFWHSPTSFQ